MDLKQLLTMLQSVSGPNSSGEYTAKCPAHQDRTASLTATVKASPKDGKEKIYLCCHAGCQGADIMAALGISAKDLIVNPDDQNDGSRRAFRSLSEPPSEQNRNNEHSRDHKPGGKQIHREENGESGSNRPEQKRG